MRYPCNYVCFPCRRNARAGMARVPGRKSMYQGSHHPLCPSCGNPMLEWRGSVPRGEKGWQAAEQSMIDNYNWCVERRSPFHPEHYMVSMRYGWSPDFGWLAGNPCAPLFFQAIPKPETAA